MCSGSPWNTIYKYLYMIRWAGLQSSCNGKSKEQKECDFHVVAQDNTEETKETVFKEYVLKNKKT